MSTSILYHCFGITGRGIHHVHSRFEEGKTIFRIGKDPTTLECSQCGSWNVRRKGAVFRRFMTLPIGMRPTIVEFPIQRVHCVACGMTRQIKTGFADPDRRYTKRFERYVLELSRHMTMTDVAGHLGISWHKVREIQKRYFERRFSCPRLGGLKWIAIDEISVGHGHRYLTVVLDLDSGAVVFVGQGKGADALDPFWRRLKASKARIEAVAMDMSQAYIAAVSTHVPDSTIVFDHFHVIKLFNEKLTQLRQDLCREATDLLEKKVLKGTRWLLRARIVTSVPDFRTQNGQLTGSLGPLSREHPGNLGVILIENHGRRGRVRTINRKLP